MYYKALLDGNIVDALDDLQCVCYFPQIKAILRCGKKDTPHGIISTDGGSIWHVEGWPDFPEEENKVYDTVTLAEIDETEYQALREAFDSGAGAIPEPEPEPEPDDMDSLEFVREAKLSAMGKACEAAIQSGFSVTDAGGITHHYTLDVTDQIMIAQLAVKAQNGAEQLPWHADGEACRFYTGSEILGLNREMEELITYQQTYFNSLKQYLLSLGTVAEVSAVWYGMEIPEEYQSEVLLALIRDGGVDA